MKLPTVTESGRKRLGQVIKKHRIEKGLSQQAVCDLIFQRTKTRFYKGQVSGIERGSHVPTWDTLSKVVSVGFLPFTVNELMEIATETRKVSVAREDSTPYLVSKAEDLFDQVKTLPDEERRKLNKFIEAIAV